MRFWVRSVSSPVLVCRAAILGTEKDRLNARLSPSFMSHGNS